MVGRRYELSSPPSGEHFHFHTSARRTGTFGFTWTLAPGKTGPAEHTHPYETESFRIVSGRLNVWMEGVLHELGPGDELAVPPNTRHRFLCPGPEPVVAEVSLDGTRMEDQFVPLAALLPEGRTSPRFGEILRAVPHIARSMRQGSVGPVGVGGRLFVHLTGAVAAFLSLFGLRALDPVIGWDQERNPRPSEPARAA